MGDAAGECKKPGYRRSADELLAAVALLNLLIVILFGAAAVLILWMNGMPRSAAGFGLGVGIVGIASSIAWLFDLLINRFLQGLQKYALPCAYFLKITMLLVCMPLISSWGYPSLKALLIGFVAAVILTLLGTSAVIMRADGPDFET
ncbi:hypothetical protein RQN30_04700 [Arcanobacterium hippocoleae]